MNTYSTQELSKKIRHESGSWSEAHVVTLMDKYRVFNGPTYDKRGFIQARRTGGISTFGVDLGWKDKATCRFTEMFYRMILNDCKTILTGNDIEENNDLLLSYLKNKNKNNESKKVDVMDFGKELEIMLAKAKDYDVLVEKLKITETELEKEIQNREELELTIRDLKQQVGELMDEKKQLNSLQKDMAGTEYQQIMASLGKFKNDLNQLFSDNFEIQKQAKALQTQINALDNRRNNLAAGLSSIYKESKKLNLNSFDK